MEIKKMTDTAIVPTRGSKKAAGYDLYADCCVQISPGETRKIGTGIAVVIPDGYAGMIFARSGIAVKQGLRPANCVGVVDADYRGEVIVALHNDSSEPRNITRGDRIAQMVVMPFFAEDLIVVDSLSETERGSGGFGSTGK